MTRRSDEEWVVDIRRVVDNEFLSSPGYIHIVAAIRQEERAAFAEEIIAEHGGGPLKWLKFIGATALRQLAKEQPK